MGKRDANLRTAAAGTRFHGHFPYTSKPLFSETQDGQECVIEASVGRHYIYFN